MDFTSELEIREQIALYLKGEHTLNEFQDWFVPRSWNFHENANLALQKLVASIELAIAEFTNGDWSRQELHDMLNLLLNTYEVDYDPLNPQRQQSFSVRTESGSSVLESPLTYSWTPADIQFSAEPA
jgi:hypothetical protein